MTVAAAARAAAPLVVAGDRFLTFQALANLLGGAAPNHLHAFYAMDPAALAPYYDLFDRLLRVRSPALAAHLADCGIVVEMFLFGWLQTVFLKCLPLAAAARVWDGFLLEGVPHLYRTAAGLLDALTPHMLGGDVDGGPCSFEDTIQILTQSHAKADAWAAAAHPDVLLPAIDAVVLPVDIALELQDLVHDPFFYRHAAAGGAAARGATGGGGGDGGRLFSLARSPAAAGGSGGVSAWPAMYSPAQQQAQSQQQQQRHQRAATAAVAAATRQHGKRQHGRRPVRPLDAAADGGEAFELPPAVSAAGAAASTASSSSAPSSAAAAPSLMDPRSGGRSGSGIGGRARRSSSLASSASASGTGSRLAVAGAELLGGLPGAS